MKIAIVSFNLFVAGGARLIFNLAHELVGRGHRVTIYTPDLDAAAYGDLTRGLDIRVVTTRRPITYFKSRKPQRFLGWLSAKLKHERGFIDASRSIAAAVDADVDVLSIHDSAYRVGYYYRRRNANARVAWTVNGPPFRYLPRGRLFYDLFGYGYQFLRRLMTKRFMRSIDEATVLANADRSWLAGYPVHHVSVVRAGLDFNKFYAPVKDYREKARRKFVQLFAVGALNEHRRYNNVLAAVRYLRDRGYDAHARIVANNIWNEDQCRDSLIAFVRDNKLEDAVELNFNGVSEDELVRCYRDADIFVQAVYVPPPGHHGWGLVNFEAMAAGIPVVVCRSSTATEILTDGKDVLLVDPLSPEQIAEQVQKLVDDPELYKSIAEAGQNVARGMSWERYGEEMLRVFGLPATDRGERVRV